MEPAVGLQLPVGAARVERSTSGLVVLPEPADCEGSEEGREGRVTSGVLVWSESPGVRLAMDPRELPLPRQRWRRGAWTLVELLACSVALGSCTLSYGRHLLRACWLTSRYWLALDPPPPSRVGYPAP